MKNVRLVLCLVLFAGAAHGQAMRWVAGYTRPDGVYVQPHWESAPAPGALSPGFAPALPRMPTAPSQALPSSYGQKPANSSYLMPPAPPPPPPQSVIPPGG